MEVFQEINLDLRNVSIVNPESSQGTTSTHLDHAQFALGHIAQFDLLDGHCLARPPIERPCRRTRRRPSRCSPRVAAHPLVSHVSHLVQSGRTENREMEPLAGRVLSTASQRSRSRSRSRRFIQNKEAAAGRKATRTNGRCICRPGRHACAWDVWTGPCRLHLTTQNARTRRGKRNSGSGGENGVEQRWEPRQKTAAAAPVPTIKQGDRSTYLVLQPGVLHGLLLPMALFARRGVPGILAADTTAAFPLCAMVVRHPGAAWGAQSSPGRELGGAMAPPVVRYSRPRLAQAGCSPGPPPPSPA